MLTWKKCLAQGRSVDNQKLRFDLYSSEVVICVLMSKQRSRNHAPSHPSSTRQPHLRSSAIAVSNHTRSFRIRGELNESISST